MRGQWAISERVRHVHTMLLPPLDFMSTLRNTAVSWIMRFPYVRCHAIAEGPDKLGNKLECASPREDHRSICHHVATMVARRALTVACSLASSVAAYTLPPSCSTLGAALHAAEHTFDQKGVPEALLSAEHLLTRAAGLGTSRSALAQQLDEPLGEEVRTRFEGMCEQRLRRVPVQYILGDWDFHALTLSVAPPVLIPRPETEQLVELVLETHADLDGDDAAPPRLLDVGCGSGAIGLALLNKMRCAECVGLDVRSEATELASRNAVTLGLAERYRVALVEGGIAEFSPVESERFDVIVSFSGIEHDGLGRCACIAAYSHERRSHSPLDVSPYAFHHSHSTMPFHHAIPPHSALPHTYPRLAVHPV